MAGESSPSNTHSAKTGGKDLHETDKDLVRHNNIITGVQPCSIASPAHPQDTILLPAQKALVLEWEDLSFRVGQSQILHCISGSVRSGEVTAVMGPSGAGKSSLINILSGRQNVGSKGSHCFGTIKLGNAEITSSRMRHYASLVMQDDALVATQSVRETLRFAARMGSPHLCDVEAEVEEMIELLGLSRVADSLIGNNVVRGVSGGERKRVAVGVELINSHKIMFLDEPTSGLDSYSSYQLILLLKSIARKRDVMIVLSVHQPSSEVFANFDNVLCLKDGETFYFGPVNCVTPFFEDPVRFDPPRVCGLHYNPADFLLLQTQTCDEFPDNPMEYLVKGTVANHEIESAKTVMAPFPRQFAALLKRDFQGVYRDTAGLRARFLGNGIAISLIGGLFYFKIMIPSGDLEATASFDEIVVNPAKAVISMILAIFMGVVMPNITTFPSNRASFVREYTSNLYGVIPYFFSKVLVEVVLSFFHVLCVVIIMYFFVRLQGNLGFYLLTLWLFAICGASLPLAVGSIASSPESAAQMMPLIILPQMLFCGLYIPVASMPGALKWIHNIIMVKFAINLLSIEEFKTSVANASDDMRLKVTNHTEMYFKTQEIEKDRTVQYFLCMIAMATLFFIMSLVILKRKAQYVF